MPNTIIPGNNTSKNPTPYLKIGRSMVSAAPSTFMSDCIVISTSTFRMTLADMSGVTDIAAVNSCRERGGRERGGKFNRGPDEAGR